MERGAPKHMLSTVSIWSRATSGPKLIALIRHSEFGTGNSPKSECELAIDVQHLAPEVLQMIDLEGAVVRAEHFGISLR